VTVIFGKILDELQRKCIVWEGKGKPFSSADIRFTTKDEAIYAIIMGWPESHKVSITSLKSGNANLRNQVSKVYLLGKESQALDFTVDEEGLHLKLPENEPSLSYAFALKIV